MQKKSKVILAVAAASTLALGAAAGIASADGGWGKGHGGHRGGMMGMQMMERYDADKDGKLTQQEIDTNRTAWHGEFDADKSAALSLEEFKALWLKARNEEMVREFQRFDRDGNGQVTLDEYKEPLSRMVSEHDRNGDGVLSPEDRKKHKERHGHRMHNMKEQHAMGSGMGSSMGSGMGEGQMDGMMKQMPDAGGNQQMPVEE